MFLHFKELYIWCNSLAKCIAKYFKNTSLKTLLFSCEIYYRSLFFCRAKKFEKHWNKDGESRKKVACVHARVYKCAKRTVKWQPRDISHFENINPRVCAAHAINDITDVTRSILRRDLNKHVYLYILF